MSIVGTLLLPLSSVRFLEVFSVCVLFIYTISISIICVSEGELSLIASNEQIYNFCKWVIFEKKKLWKVSFDISELFSVIQIAAVSTWQLVLIYIYMVVSVYIYMAVSLSVLCIFVCMCVKYIARSFWYKVPRLDIYRSIILLSEITHQIWHNHLFSPRNKTSKIAVEVEVGGSGEEGLEKILKRWGR